jgi:hypothetical protein
VTLNDAETTHPYDSYEAEWAGNGMAACPLSDLISGRSCWRAPGLAAARVLPRIRTDIQES